MIWCCNNNTDEAGAIPDEAEERDGDDRAEERHHRGGIHQRRGHQDERLPAERQDHHQGYLRIHSDKNPIHLDQLTVRGSSVRYVILPETLQLDSLLVEEEAKVKKAKAPTKRSKRPRRDRR
jgi:hypothetical protein